MDHATEIGFGAFAARLRALGAEAARASADSYLAAHAGGFPLVEGNAAHFVYRAPADAQIGVGGDWNGFNGRLALLAPLGGGLLHYAREFAPDSRINYQFFVYPAGESKPVSQADPLNLRVGEAGMGVPNELAMPGYRRPPATLGQPGVPAGTLHPGTLQSKALRQ